MSRRETYLPTHVPKLGRAERDKLRILRAARGIPALVDLVDVQEHITWLRSIGFLDNAIGAAAGLPGETVTKIRTGVHERVRIEQAARIRAVTHVPVEAQMRTMVPTLGARRRVHALWALGHTSEVIGSYLDSSACTVRRFCKEKRMQGANWLAVRGVYDGLSSTPGESALLRDRAAARGLPAPLDWEGLDIDHPDHMPVPAQDKKLVDEVLVARILKGSYKGAVPKLERDAVMDYAIERGWSGAKVAEVLGMRTDSASRAIVKHRRKNHEVAS